MLTPSHCGSGVSREGRHSKGFTLIELMITIALLAVLMALAFPSLSGMIKNTQVRTVSDALQNGLRLAQLEAVRRNQQVVFTLTNDEPGSASTADENGRNWAIHTVPRTGDAEAEPEFVRGGAFSDSARGVEIDGPAAVCFASNGRLTANAVPGVTDAVCDISASPEPYNVTLTGADRPLRVTLSLGGQVRMCDPNKTLSATSPDGCSP